MIQSDHMGGQLAARDGVAATATPYDLGLVTTADGVAGRVMLVDYTAESMRVDATVGENEMLLRYGMVFSMWGKRLAVASHRYTADGENLGSAVVLYRLAENGWEVATVLSSNDIVNGIETDSDTTSFSSVGEAIALGEGVILVGGETASGTAVYQIEENAGTWSTRSVYTSDYMSTYRRPFKLAVEGNHGIIVETYYSRIRLIDLSAGTIAQSITVDENSVDAIAFQNGRVALAYVRQQYFLVQLFEFNDNDLLEAADRIEYQSSFDIYNASVSLSSERLAVGARSASSDAKSGLVVVYELNNNQWRLEAELGYGLSNPPPYDPGEGFGHVVALDGDDLLVGKWDRPSGALYRYHLARPAGADCRQHFDCIHRLCKGGQCADVDSGPWGSDWDAGVYEPAVTPVDEEGGCSVYSINPSQGPPALLLLGIVLLIVIVRRRIKA